MIIRKEFEQWKLDMIMLERSIKELVVLIVTIRGKEEDGFVDEKGNPYDFVSRCFAPWTGVPEDPVTGKTFLFCFILPYESPGKKDCH